MKSNTSKTSCKRGVTQIIKVILSRGHYLWAASRKVVIRDLIKWTQDLRRLSLPLVNSMRGRSRIKYGMTGLLNNSAFTLIELLVVVLIIGILAAVAVPQYKKAVKKSKATRVEVILDTVNKAVDMYLLENGLPQSGYVYFTGKNSVSPIDLPGDCSKDNNCYTDVGNFYAVCVSSYCEIDMYFGYNADGTDDPPNTWLSSEGPYLWLSKTAPGGKWRIGDIIGINKNSTNAEDKQAGEVISPIVEKYVAEDDETFVAKCK